MRKLFEAQFNGFPLQQEWNCLEAWTADAELPSGDPTLVWGCSGTEITGTVDTIGGGDDNSDLIIAGCSETPSAVRAARQTFGTLSDWYLPTGIELQAMYAQRSIISDFATGIKTYWTSSEHDATTAYYMDGGAVAAGAKTGERYARPIRKVSGNYEIGDTGPAGGIIFYKRQAEPTHKLSIYDTTLAEDGSSQDITLEAPGYAINWNGNVNDIVGGGIIESSAEFTVRSIDGILSDFMDDLASSIEGRFLVEIQKKTVLTETWEGSWKGILMTDFSGRKDIPDEPISFQATDGMALLDAIEVTATASELMLVTILKGLAQIPTVSLFSALSETRFLWVKTDWFADNIPADEEPLYQIGLYGKSLWVKKEEKKGYSGTIATIVSPMTYKEIIQHICERFNCILMMQQGSWYLFQRDLMEEDTITFETYKSAESLGTWRTNPWTYTVETYKELDQDNRYRSEGEFYSLPGIKSAEVIYGGGALADGSDSLIPTAWEPDEVYTTMPLYTGTGNYLHIRASFTEHFLIDWVGGTPPEQYFKARAEYKLIVTCGSYYLNAYTKGWTLDSSVADLVLSSTYLYHRYDSESDTWSFIDQALFNLDLITDDLPTDDEVIFELSRYQIQIFSGGTYFTCDIADDFLFTPDLDNHFMLFIVGDENPVSYVTFKAENPTAGFQLEYDRGESLFGTARVIMNRVIGYNNAGGELWNKGYTSTKTMYFNQLLVQQILANQIKGLLSFSGTIYERSENWLQLRHAIELTVNGTTYRLVFNNVTYVAQTESWQGDWVEISNTKGLAIPPLNENEFGIDDKPFIPRPPGPIFEDVLEELYDLESGNVDVTQGGNSTGGVITNRTTFVKQPALPSTPTMGTMAIGLAEIGIMKQFDAFGNLKTLGIDASYFEASPDVVIVGGFLYNWLTANLGTDLINDPNWAVPRTADFLVLTNYLISQGYNYDDTKIGDKLGKALATATGWDASAVVGAIGNTDYPAKQNVTGLSIKPTGLRNVDGTYVSQGLYGGLWNSTEIDTDDAYAQDALFNEATYAIGGGDKKGGMGIRIFRFATAPELGLGDLTIISGAYTGNDGKVYDGVILGTHVWIVKNLAETKYTDGTEIPLCEDADIWGTLAVPARCAYDNDMDNVFTDDDNLVLKDDKLLPSHILSYDPTLSGLSAVLVKTALDEIVSTFDGYVPYTGATSDLDLGANLLKTTSGLVSPKWYPSADSVTALQILKADGTTPIVNIDTTNSRVGIGTILPLGALDVSSGAIGIVLGADLATTTRTNSTAKASSISMPHYLNAEELITFFGGYADATNNYMVFGGGSTASNAVTDIAFYTAANNTTVEGTERMRITSAGLIGIGITAPLGKAHIYAGASLGTPNSGSNLIIEDNGTNIIQLLSPNTTVQGIMFGDSESPFAGYIRYSHADDEMSFYTDHTKRLLINSSGYVGIGASVTPLSLLDVSGGDIYIDHNQGISLVDNRSGTAVIRNMIKGTYPDGAVSNLGTIEIGQNTNRVASIFFSTQNGDRGMNFAQGKLGIGVGATNPTAYLEIKAGTAAAGTAPIKLTAGLLLTTPETGTIEFYGNKFTITNKSARKVIDRTSDVKLTTSTVTNDIAETTVFTGLLPANSLVAGNILKLEMFGTIDEAAASDEVTIRIKVGTMTMATIVSPASGVSAKCWHIKGSAIVRTVGASGEMAWHIDMDAAGNSEDGCGVDTVDTTAAENITVTAEWSAAKAGNIFTCTGGFIEYKN